MAATFRSTSTAKLLRHTIFLLTLPSPDETLASTQKLRGFVVLFLADKWSSRELTAPA